MGCSDPPTPSAYAGLTITLGSPTNPDVGECGVGASNAFRVGDPVPVSTDVGRPILSGEEGVTASCSVTGSSPYRVRAKVSRDDFDFELWGRVARDAPSRIEGTLTAAPPVDRNLYTNECNITPIEVRKGELFASYDCDNAPEHGYQGVGCKFSGIVAMLRCEQE
jgi:hypothetical protein